MSLFNKINFYDFNCFNCIYDNNKENDFTCEIIKEIYYKNKVEFMHCTKKIKERKFTNENKKM